MTLQLQTRQPGDFWASQTLLSSRRCCAVRVRQGPSPRVRARAGAKIPGAALNDCTDNCRRGCATRWAGAYHRAGAHIIVLLGAALQRFKRL